MVGKAVAMLAMLGRVYASAVAIGLVGMQPSYAVNGRLMAGAALRIYH